jgi:hypothetical protein
MQGAPLRRAGVHAAAPRRRHAAGCATAAAQQQPQPLANSGGGGGGVAIVLVGPARGENIGAAARAMKNFGLRVCERRPAAPAACARAAPSPARLPVAPHSLADLPPRALATARKSKDLRLVAPVQPWPNERAAAVAARARDVAAGARVYATLGDALEDREYVYATSGRPRGVGAYLPTVPASRLADELPAGQRARGRVSRDEGERGGEGQPPETRLWPASAAAATGAC